MDRLSPSFEREAVRSGYYAYQYRGNNAHATHYGYTGGRATWCWYTGFETARTRQSLTAAYHTLTVSHA